MFIESTPKNFPAPGERHLILYRARRSEKLPLLRSVAIEFALSLSIFSRRLSYGLITTCLPAGGYAALSQLIIHGMPN
jgi:hypothetical protein